MVPEVFSGTLERLTCQLYHMVDDIKRYTVLEALWDQPLTFKSIEIVFYDL